MKKVQRLNSLVLDCVAGYLIENDQAIEAEEVKNLAKECDIDEIEAYKIILASLFGFDLDGNKSHYEFYQEYLSKCVKVQDKNDYENNPYYKHVIPLPKKEKGWTLSYEKYVPFQGFIYNDFEIFEDGKTLPCLGIFKEEFKYLAVKEDGNIWMSITPNEINTMKKPIENASGNVLTLGLGLGYFQYMASLKDEVKHITIIEKDENVINLFKTQILPFFENKDKIEIKQMDAIDALKDLKDIDYVFCDIWHDASDGINHYLRMVEYEKNNPNVFFDYWIEKSILVYLVNYYYNDKKINDAVYYLTHLDEFKTKYILNK